jgi:hypothetical protein
MYRPTVNDMSGQLLGDGIKTAGSSLAEAIKEVDQTRKETEIMSGYVLQAQKSGALPPKSLAEFAAGNRAKKMQLGTAAQVALRDMQLEKDRGLQQQRINLDSTVAQDLERHRNTADQFTGEELGVRKTDSTVRNAVSLADLGLKQQEFEESKKPLVLTPEELATYQKAGAVPLRVTKHAFNVMGLPKTPVMPKVEDLPRTIINGREAILLPKGYSLGTGGAARTTPNKPLTMGESATLAAVTTQLAKIDAEISEHTTEIANGDERTGFMNLSSRKEKIAELEGKKAGLTAQLEALQNRGGTPATSGPAKASPGAGTPATPAKAAGNKPLSSATAAAVRSKELPLPESDPLASPEPGSVVPPIGGGPVTVKSPGDAQALAPGTKYQTPDGRIFVR